MGKEQNEGLSVSECKYDAMRYVVNDVFRNSSLANIIYSWKYYWCEIHYFIATVNCVSRPDYYSKCFIFQNFITNAPQCDNNGDFKCGVCSCHSGFIGQHCECELSSKEGRPSITGDLACKETNTSEVCSGQGKCVCGECICNEREEPEVRILFFPCPQYAYYCKISLVRL